MTDKECIGIAVLARSRLRRLLAAINSLNRIARLNKELFSFKLRAANGAVTILLLKPRNLVTTAERALRAFECDFELRPSALPLTDNFLGGIDVTHKRKLANRPNNQELRHPESKRDEKH